MKICHLLWSFTTGGTETMLVDIANEQAVQNNVSIVIVNDYFDQYLLGLLNTNINVVLIGRPTQSINPWYLLKMNFTIWKLHPDIVHVHADGIYKYYKLSIPIVCTVHNMVKPAKDVLFYKQLYCISSAVENVCRTIGNNNTKVVYNGIKTDLVLKRSFNLSQSFFKIVCVGRLSEVKGQHLLIEACNSLVKNHNFTKFHIDFIGEGDTLDYLESMVDNYALSSYITFCGIQPRSYIYSHLCDYDLYVMPSLSEGFGLTLAEAISAKVPVVCCNLPGPMEVIDNGEFGYSFEAGNVESLTNVLFEYLKNPADEQQLDNAYKFVVEHFDVRNTARQYLIEYNKFLNS